MSACDFSSWSKLKNLLYDFCFFSASTTRKIRIWFASIVRWLFLFLEVTRILHTIWNSLKQFIPSLKENKKKRTEWRAYKKGIESALYPFPVVSIKIFMHKFFFWSGNFLPSVLLTLARHANIFHVPKIVNEKTFFSACSFCDYHFIVFISFTMRMRKRNIIKSGCKSILLHLFRSFDVNNTTECWILIFRRATYICNPDKMNICELLIRFLQNEIKDEKKMILIIVKKAYYYHVLVAWGLSRHKLWIIGVYFDDEDGNAVFNVSFRSMNYMMAQFSIYHNVDIKVNGEFLLTYYDEIVSPATCSSLETCIFHF